MELYEAIRSRKSIRHYGSEALENDLVQRVLEAARLAPSWKNLQCWRFIVVDNEESKKGILAAIPDANPGKKGVATAPVTIVLCADPQASGVMGDRHYYLVDSGIVMEHLILAACNEGLGTCWIGVFEENAVKSALGIPADWRVVAMTPLGYPKQESRFSVRKTLPEIVYRNKWNNQF